MLPKALRHSDPLAFDILTSVKVRHMDVTDKWDIQASHPTLAVDGSGQVERVYFNERTRDSWRAWGVAAGAGSRSAGSCDQFSGEFYRALKRFEQLVEDPSFHINTPLQPGELVLFDNARVLHSRTARLPAAGLVFQCSCSCSRSCSCSCCCCCSCLPFTLVLLAGVHPHRARPHFRSSYWYCRVSHDVGTYCSLKEFVGERHMEGAYLEWGAFYATWRGLQPQVEQQPAVYCGNTVGKGSGMM